MNINWPNLLKEGEFVKPEDIEEVGAKRLRRKLLEKPGKYESKSLIFRIIEQVYEQFKRDFSPAVSLVGPPRTKQEMLERIASTGVVHDAQELFNHLLQNNLFYGISSGPYTNYFRIQKIVDKKGEERYRVREERVAFGDC